MLILEDRGNSVGKPVTEGSLGNRRNQAEGALGESPTLFLQLCHLFANYMSQGKFSVCHARCWALKALGVEIGVTEILSANPSSSLSPG